MLEAMDVYSSKHYNRADRNLKRTYYVHFVLSQMTLLQDKKLDKKQASKASEQEGQTSKSEDKKARKRDKKLKTKKEATLDKHRKNLFSN